MTRKKSLDELLAEENETLALDNVGEVEEEDDSYLLSRDATTRDAEEEYIYTPQAHLPEIKVEDGYVARWVRASIFGAQDAANVSSMLREGWTPLDASDSQYRDLARQCGLHGRNDSTSNLIELGGLIACKMPRAKAEARARYYDQQARNKIRAEDARMRGESNSKMPLAVEERKFRTSTSMDG
jgi:hypothetical protein